MKNTIFLFLLILYYSFSFSQENQQAAISGFIENQTEHRLQIGDQNVSIAEDGKFLFNIDLKSPVLLDISYASSEWTIFLNPESKINFSIHDVKNILPEYSGDLVSCNTYLLKVDSVSKTANSFFDQNWISMHKKNQEEYISIIDSLKNMYLIHFANYQTYNETISEDFVKVWKTDINYGFNTLIVKYPLIHFQLTQNNEELNAQSIAYLESTKINKPEYFELESYKRYSKALIAYKSRLMAEKDQSNKHFNLKKIEGVFKIIPEMFDTQYLSDFWLCEFLKEYIDKNQLANSGKYISQYYLICETEQFKEEIEKQVNLILDGQKDHEVKIYKTEYDFNLEAHIFKPESMTMDGKCSAIAIFHGGGWNGGNPSWAFDRARHFKALGMVAIAVQYRLTNEHDITALESMADARDLIRWVKMNCDSLNLSPDKVAAYGWSAGGHLVASSAIFSDSILQNRATSTPDAMILVSPAVSLPKGEGWEIWKLNVFGRRTMVSSVNPVEHVRKGLPPTIIVQGRDDTVTPFGGVQLFHDNMLKHENYSELWVYDGVGHLFTPNSIPDYGQPYPDKEVQKKAFDQIDKFLIKFGYIK